MNINMQLLENMTEQERFDWFEDIPEEELLAQLDAMAEPERRALLEKNPGRNPLQHGLPLRSGDRLPGSTHPL